MTDEENFLIAEKMYAEAEEQYNNAKAKARQAYLESLRPFENELERAKSRLSDAKKAYPERLKRLPKDEHHRRLEIIKGTITEGGTLRDAGRLLGISHQRCRAILRENKIWTESLKSRK